MSTPSREQDGIGGWDVSLGQALGPEFPCAVRVRMELLLSPPCPQSGPALSPVSPQPPWLVTRQGAGAVPAPTRSRGS